MFSREEAKQAFNNLNGTASLGAADLASDPAAQPNSAPELSSLPWHPTSGILERKSFLVDAAAQADRDCGPVP